MKKIIFLFFIITSMTVLAQDSLLLESCNEEGPYRLENEICAGLIDSSYFKDLSETDQKRYVLNMYTQNAITPYDKMEFAKDWNKNNMPSSMLDLPQGSTYESNDKCNYYSGADCILNSWLAIPGPISSFVYNKEEFVKTSDEVQVIYSYDLDTPKDKSLGSKCSCSKPKTKNTYEDCKTKFSYEDLSILTIHSDDQIVYEAKTNELGGSVIADFLASGEDQDFVAELKIVNKITIDSWQWKSEGFCGSSCEDCCTKRDWQCTGNHDQETSTDSKTIKKSISTKVYQTTTDKMRVNVLDFEDKPIVNLTSAASNFKIEIGSSELNKLGHSYELNWSYAPYNTLKLVKIENKADIYFGSNLIMKNKDNKSVVVELPIGTNVEACRITYNNPFDTVSEICSTEFSESDKVKLATDNSVYDTSQTIELELDFSDNDAVSETVEVRYANVTYTLNLDSTKTAKIELEPVIGQDTIDILYNGVNYSKKVSVIEEDHYFNLLVFIAIVAIFFIGIKAYVKYGLERF